MEVVRLINLSFQIWGSILSIVIILCLVIAGKTKTEGERLYLAMLGCNMGTMLMDALAFLFRGHTGNAAWLGVRVFNYAQFVFGHILSFLFVFYLKEYIESALNVKVNKLYTKVAVVSLAVSEFLITANLVYPFLYTIDEQNIYSRLPLYPVMYVTLFVMLFMALSLLFNHWTKLKKSTAVSFLIYALIPSVSLIGSILVYGITFSYIGTTIALTVLFLYLQFEREQGTIEKAAEDKVEKLRDYEKLVNEGIKISMQAENPDDNINAMLRYFGEMLGGQRVYIFEKNEKNEDCNTYEWCAKGVKTQIDILQNLPPEICAPLYESIQNKEAVIFKNFEGVSACNPFVRKNIAPKENDTIVVFPLWNKQQVIGFFGVNNPADEIRGMSQDIFEIIANFIVSMFKKRDLINQLQVLSYTDVATGARNRLAMYNHFEMLREKNNIGVMFCDITGLKETNDTRGHSMGDELIRKTYLCIEKCFGSFNTFRIGGDEFVVLCSGLSEADFEKKIGQLREDLKEKEIVAAIGAEWRKDVAKTVNQTLMQAECMMYEEKNNWYINHHKERRELL